MDEIATLEDIVSRSLAQERFLTILAGAFALLAGLLAVVGVYGVTAQLAHGWKREFAVRIAVGAEPRSLFGIVVSRAAALVVGGLLLGGLGALAMARVVEAFLFETSASDPKLVLAAAALVAVTGIAAAVPPAVRAMRTDPARSLAA
jgi:putative ABC transport system permease protein